MKNNIGTKLSMGILTLALLVAPQLSYADWGARVSVGGPGPGYHEDGHSFYRYHDHPNFGVRIGYLPVGYATVHVGWHSYYYYDGLYYNNVGGQYVIVNPPVGAYVSVIPPDFQPVIFNGRTYYADNGVFYILTRHHGYKVVNAPRGYVRRW